MKNSAKDTTALTGPRAIPQVTAVAPPPRDLNAEAVRERRGNIEGEEEEEEEKQIHVDMQMM